MNPNPRGDTKGHVRKEFYSYKPLLGVPKGSSTVSFALPWCASAIASGHPLGLSKKKKKKKKAVLPPHVRCNGGWYQLRTREAQVHPSPGP